MWLNGEGAGTRGAGALGGGDASRKRKRRDRFEKQLRGVKERFCLVSF